MDEKQTTQNAHDLGPQAEEGFSPGPSQPDILEEKIEPVSSIPPASRSATFTAPFRKATTWASSVRDAVRPNMTPAVGLTRVRTLEEYPEGYPRLSYILNSDESFMMYRQFGQLHSRILLYKQDQIRELEDELAALDRRDNKSDKTKLYLSCRADDEDRDFPSGRRTRQVVMEEIEKKLLEYGTIMKQTSQFQNMSKPTKRDHDSVKNYIFSKQPLVEGDRDFIQWKEDLVTLRSGQQRAWLDAKFESAVGWLLRLYPSRFISRAFSSKESSLKTVDRNIYYVDRKRINRVVTFLISLVLIPVVITPVYLLYYLTEIRGLPVTNGACIAVLLVSGFVFSLGLGVFTQAKRHEILGTVAAYCAILVVFISQPPGGSAGN